jgi:hypothetical protein
MHEGWCVVDKRKRMVLPETRDGRWTLVSNGRPRTTDEGRWMSNGGREMMDGECRTGRRKVDVEYEAFGQVN